MGPYRDHKALWEAYMLSIASLFYVEIMFQQMQRLIMALPMMHQNIAGCECFSNSLSTLVK